MVLLEIDICKVAILSWDGILEAGEPPWRRNLRHFSQNIFFADIRAMTQYFVITVPTVNASLQIATLNSSDSFAMTASVRNSAERENRRGVFDDLRGMQSQPR
jgi:hypothetical protein